MVETVSYNGRYGIGVTDGPGVRRDKKEAYGAMDVGHEVNKKGAKSAFLPVRSPFMMRNHPKACS